MANTTNCIMSGDTFSSICLYYFNRLTSVAIIVAMDAVPEARATTSAVVILLLRGFDGTTISHPGSGFTPLPILATVPFIYIIYVRLFLARLPHPPAWST